MQTTIMINVNNTPRRNLVTTVLPSCRPSNTPQTTPAAPPPKKAIMGEVLPLFAPNKTAKMLSKTGAISAKKTTHQLVLTGGNKCWDASASDGAKSRPQNGHHSSG